MSWDTATTIRALAASACVEVGLSPSWCEALEPALASALAVYVAAERDRAVAELRDSGGCGAGKCILTVRAVEDEGFYCYRCGCLSAPPIADYDDDGGPLCTPCVEGDQ